MSKKKKKTASVYEVEARKSMETIRYAEQMGRRMSQYDVYIAGSQLSSGENRKTMVGYHIVRNGRGCDKGYTSMSDTSLPKAILQTVVKVSKDITTDFAILIHTSDSFTCDFINHGWSGPKTQEEADGIMEQRKSHVCLTAVMDNSPILGKITHDCRMMMYKQTKY